MARKSRVIHLGAFLEGFEAGLEGRFEYENIYETDVNVPLVVNDEPLLINGELNELFRNDLFLITQQRYLQPEQASLLKALPANAMIIDHSLDMTEAAQEALYLKNPQWIKYQSAEELAEQLRKYFFMGQLGYKLTFDQIKISPSFAGTVNQVGHNYLEIEDEGTDEYQPILKWRLALPIEPKSQWDIRFEHENLNANADIKLRVKLLNPSDEKVYSIQDIENEALNQHITVEVQPQGGFLVVELLARGANIHLKVGQIRVWHARDGRGDLMIGEDEIVDETQLNSSILCYFDPGDFKPPLNIYFSGFRTAEGVEGVFMMRGFKSPTLIFGDQRILGGSFYVGSEKIQSAIIDKIQQTLKKLNFEPDQLILSGLSMGTYAAMYYSSFLNPAWVIVGKPLVNLGDIAANERINRPDDFPTSLDVLLRLTDGTDEDHVQQANEYFWKSFAQYDHQKTNFVIAYMENDDYDQKAFEQLTEYLHHYAPNIRIVHKGLVGRHNDATGPLTDWFIRQYRNVLSTNFDRVFED
jgi:accessory secretory protein Asp2